MKLVKIGFSNVTYFHLPSNYKLYSVGDRMGVLK